MRCCDKIMEADRLSPIALVPRPHRKARSLPEWEANRHSSRPRPTTAGILKGVGQGQDSGNTHGGEGAVL